jgi:hypothetical protein
VGMGIDSKEKRKAFFQALITGTFYCIYHELSVYFHEE